MGEFEVSNKSLNLVARDKTLDRGFHLHEYQLRKGALSEKKIVNFLRKHQGFYPRTKLKGIFPACAIQRLEFKREVFTVDLNLSRGVGDYKHSTQSDIFQQGYFPYRFVCLGRSGLVRLMQNALKRPKDSCTQTILTHFLKRCLTDAERFAVLWKLGIHLYDADQVKRSIQIDGVVMAKRKGVGV